MHLHQITLEIGGKINHCQIAQRLLLTNLRSIYWNITTNTCHLIAGKQRTNNLGEKTHFMNFIPENERYHFWSMPGKSSYEDTDNDWYQSSMNMKMVIATGIGAIKVNDPHLFSKYGDFEKLSCQRANVVSYDILCFNLYSNSPEVSWYLLVCELGQTNF